MACANTYQLATAKWTPAGGSEISIVGLKNIVVSEAGSEEPINSDSKPARQGAHMFDLHARVTINYIDQEAVLNKANFYVGLHGVLVIEVRKSNTLGSGYLDGSETTFTFTDAAIANINSPFASDTESVASIEFSCCDADGVYPYGV